MTDHEADIQISYRVIRQHGRVYIDAEDVITYLKNKMAGYPLDQARAENEIRRVIDKTPR